MTTNAHSQNEIWIEKYVKSSDKKITAQTFTMFGVECHKTIHITVMQNLMPTNIYGFILKVPTKFVFST